MPFRPVLRLVGAVTLILAAVVVAGGTAAAAGSVELTLRATGSVTSEIQTKRDVDDAHFCALLGPAGKEQTLVLAFNHRQTDTLLGATDFGFSLSIPGTVGRTWNETHPSTILQVSIADKRYVGLHEADPAFHLEVSLDAGGDTGTFHATHLRDPSTTAVINVDGSWHCMPIQRTPDADPPAVGRDAPSAPTTGVLSSAAPSGRGLTEATPSDAPAPGSSQSPVAPVKEDVGPLRQSAAEVQNVRSFRLYHAAPCSGSSCNAWVAVDARSGRVFNAVVVFHHLRIPAPLAAAARAGLVELWVTGDQSGNRKQLLISAQRLDGIAPRRAEPVEGNAVAKQ